MSDPTISLKVLLPTEVLLEREVRKLTFEGGDGARGVLPRHIDFVSTVVPGILSFIPEDGSEERYIAVDAGILVKKGREVLVSVRKGVKERKLGELKTAIEELFHQRSEQEKKAQSVLAGLEADFARRYLEGR